MASGGESLIEATSNDCADAAAVITMTARVLRKKTLDNLAADFGEALLAAEVHVAERVLVEAHLVEQRRVQVAEVDGVLGGFQADRVRCAIDGTALEAAAGDPHGEAGVV